MSILPIACSPPPADTSVLVVPDEHALREMADPLERARTAHEIAGRLQAALDAFLAIRRDAVREAVNNGTPRPELARGIGVTAARVGQLLNGSRRHGTTRSDVDDGAVA